MSAIARQPQHAAPLFRAYLLGSFTLHWRVACAMAEPAVYTEVSPAQWGKRRQAMRLLAVLLARPGRRAGKDFLIELFWPDTEPEQAAVYLTQTVAKLRKVLRLVEGGENLLIVERAGYRLEAQEQLWMDADAAEALLQQASRQGTDVLPLLQEAVTLLQRGPFLEEAEGTWVLGRRGRLQDLRKKCQVRLAQLLAQQGRLDEAETQLFMLLEEDTTDEDVLCSLMELLHRHGMTYQALRYYQAFLEVAEREGLEPTEAIKKLATQLATCQKSTPLDAFPPSFSLMEGQNRAFSPQWRQAETHMVEATSSPLSDDQEFLPLTEKPSEHAGPLLAETRHLLGRQEWLASIIALIQAEIPKKLLVLHGPIGVGKSSELNRLAHAFLQQNASPSQVIVLSLPAREPCDPEASLDLFVGMLLSSSRAAPFPADASRQVRIKLALTALAQRPEPTVILLDNAEGTLTEEGTLAPCWEAFLTSVVRGQHHATLILASKEWPGWTGRDPQLVAEIPVPSLTLEDSVLLLQRLGLESVSHAALETISQRVACIPLCLEWIAKIAHDPLVHDEWESFEEPEETSTESRLDAAQRLTRLLQHPTLLGEHLASRLTPLLEHILDRHLSTHARRVLEHLAVVSIPLGKPALHVFCSRPALLKELRSASLLAAYANRIQLLPMVASTVRARLSPEQVYALEERMIEALRRWVEDGYMQDSEVGSVVTELVVLLLTHHYFLDAAQLLIYHGWLSFKLGTAPRIAYLTEQILGQFDWYRSFDMECGGKLLYYFLMPYIGKKYDKQQYSQDYQNIFYACIAGKIVLDPFTMIFLTHHLMVEKMDELRFAEAQTLLDSCSDHLRTLQESDIGITVALQEKRGMLLSRMCEYAEEQGEQQQSSELRERAIDVYQQSSEMLARSHEVLPLKKSRLKKIRCML